MTWYNPISWFERRGLSERVWERGLIWAEPTLSGVSIDEMSSLKLSAVYACVKILSETLASLPLHVYKRKKSGGKEIARDHLLYAVLHDRPNKRWSSFQFRETMMACLCLWGNAYAQIVRPEFGRAIELWPLRPEKMDVELLPDGDVQYKYKLTASETITFPAEKILHIRDLCLDGLMGLSRITQARESIGLGLSAENYGSRFFGNGAKPGAILEHPAKLSRDAHENLTKSIKQQVAGPNTHKLLVLEEGMKWNQITLPPNDAQFLETRNFQIRDIARWFRIPPHKIGDLERATFSNVEQQAIDFVTDFTPWLVRWEQELNFVLFSQRERGSYFVEFNTDALLRGDTQSRYAAYAIARQNGWMSANDIRSRENQNDIEGGDVYLVPLNMVPASQVGKDPSPSPEPPISEPQGTGEPPSIARSLTLQEERSVKVRERIAIAHKNMFAGTASRVVTEEARLIRSELGKLQERAVSDFQQGIQKIYVEGGFFREFARREYRPAVHTYAETIGTTAAEEVNDAAGVLEIPSFSDRYLDSFLTDYMDSSRGQIDDIIANAEPEELENAIETRVSEWEETRPGKISENEVIAIAGAVALMIWRAAGIKKLKWVTQSGKSCPFCRNLNGKIVGIEKPFLEAGEFHPPGADGPLTVRGPKRHPPIHRGCGCAILPG